MESRVQPTLLEENLLDGTARGVDTVGECAALDLGRGADVARSGVGASESALHVLALLPGRQICLTASVGQLVCCIVDSVCGALACLDGFCLCFLCGREFVLGSSELCSGGRGGVLSLLAGGHCSGVHRIVMEFGA